MGGIALNVIEAINKRFACRAFKPDPVAKETLVEILAAAAHSPSWANTQPWEVYVAAGTAIENLRQGYIDNLDNNVPLCPDCKPPIEWPEHIKKRPAALNTKRMTALGIAPDDEDARFKMFSNNYRFFNAPVLIILCLDRSAGVYSFYDLGSFAQNLMLAAQEHGLDSIPAFSFVGYPNLLRNELGISPEHMAVLGIAIGYADINAPINQVRSDKRPVAEVVKISGV
jgi:nitroreductase